MAFMGLLLLTESGTTACQVTAVQVLGILFNGKNILVVEILCVIGLSAVTLIAFSWVGSLYCRVISRLYEGSWLWEGLAVLPFDFGILLSELLSDFFKVFSLLLISLELSANIFTRSILAHVTFAPRVILLLIAGRAWPSPKAREGCSSRWLKSTWWFVVGWGSHLVFVAHVVGILVDLIWVWRSWTIIFAIRSLSGSLDVCRFLNLAQWRSFYLSWFWAEYQILFLIGGLLIVILLWDRLTLLLSIAHADCLSKVALSRSLCHVLRCRLLITSPGHWWLVQPRNVKLRLIIWSEWVLVGGLSQFIRGLFKVSRSVAALGVWWPVLRCKLVLIICNVLPFRRWPALKGLSCIRCCFSVVPTSIAFILIHALYLLVLIEILNVILNFVIRDRILMLLSRSFGMIVHIGCLIAGLILESLWKFWAAFVGFILEANTRRWILICC